MRNLFWLTMAQVDRLSPSLPRSHGRPRVDDRRVPSGIIHVNRNGLRWRDAPSAFGSHKTWHRLSRKGGSRECSWRWPTRDRTRAS